LDRGAKPAVCVLDIMLPDIDGFELRDRIRRLLGPDIPVMFVTGLPTKLLRERGELVLEKPFSGDELLRTVALALSRGLAG
jgi:CheY-like chemotaxis protein